MPYVVEGDVIVTRNPCSHPGDIRQLKAVKPKKEYFKKYFKNLFNVIVFSSKGDRPQSNMMSGGDLDGDEFFISWDQKLVSSKNHKINI